MKTIVRIKSFVSGRFSSDMELKQTLSQIFRLTGKVRLSFIISTFCIFVSCSDSSHNQAQRATFSNQYPLTYSDWANAYLAGNGKMGIMVFGNPLEETIIFNDRGFNLASRNERTSEQVLKEDLMRIKELCVLGKFAEANELAITSSRGQRGGEGSRHPGYIMSISIPAQGEVQEYSRTCDFRTGEITVEWADARGKWKRKAFVSRKDNVTVQQLEAPSGGKLTCDINLGVTKDMGFPREMSFINMDEDGFLNIRARYFADKSIGYEGVTRYIVKGGKHEIKDNILHVQDAKSVIMLSRTVKYYEDCDEKWNMKQIQKDLAKLPSDYKALMQGQIETHGQIYDRVSLNLNASVGDRAKNNETLLEEQRQSDKPVTALWERVFDAGRYYYLSSSSELTPPDLLGIWIGNCNAGWGGYYHLDSNLNLQVTSGNTGDMPEAMEGYFHINEVWASDFKINAQRLLGCRGLLSCGNTPGLSTGLMAGALNMFYPYQYATGEEPWLLYPFWEHYLITGDEKFLRERLYPLMKEMGYLYEDFLVKKDENGKFIFAGSVSPENQPSNLAVSLLNNSAFDVSGARFALSTLIQMCDILNVEQGLGEGKERWKAIYDQLPEYGINKDGAIKEWDWPGLEENYGHRHWSNLLSVTPYQEITPESTPELYAAACRTLEIKDKFKIGSGHFLLQGALIAANLKKDESVRSKLLRLTKEDFYFDNLSTSHNPQHDVFCTDVCNSVPAIMIEMLVCSSPGIVELLPALPEDLIKGKISGTKCRNRITLKELSWDKETGIIECTLISDIDQLCTIIERRGITEIKGNTEIQPSHLGNIARQLSLTKGKPVKITIKTEKG